MKYRVCIETRAIRDIDEACGWIGAQAPEAAERWFSAIEAEIYSLAHFPERCPRAREADLFPYDLRQLVYGRKQGRYRIIFTVRMQAVHVLHVRHGALPMMSTSEVDDLLPPELAP
jgi:plasmid stabilization system protein ParE